jgi:hypothetical protein
MVDARPIEITDEELAAEAMAADPNAPIDDDAQPFGGRHDAGLLPEWYMPIDGPVRRTRTRQIVVVGIIVAMLAVNGAGLCVTYGLPEIAW